MSGCNGVGTGCHICAPCANCGPIPECSLCGGSMCRIHRKGRWNDVYWTVGLAALAVGATWFAFWFVG